MSPVTETPTVPLVEVVVPGSLTAASIHRIGSMLDEAATLRPQHLVVDLTACELLDAAGVALLVRVHRQIRESGGQLALRNLPPRADRLLRLARVDRVLHITHDPVPEAGDAPVR